MENGGVNLEKTWSVVQHNYTPKIAVIYDGFLLDYEDIDVKSRILINNREIPDNYIDDDNNCFIGDYFGHSYLFCDGLSERILEIIRRSCFSCKPTLKSFSRISHHGNHVLGIIGASHDSGKGIASITKYSELIPLRNYAYGRS